MNIERDLPRQVPEALSHAQVGNALHACKSLVTQPQTEAPLQRHCRRPLVTSQSCQVIMLSSC